MPSTSRKCTWYVLKAESMGGCPEPKLIVHYVVKRIVQIAQFTENPAAKKDVGLGDVVQSTQHDFPVEVDLFLGNQGLSGFIDDQVVAVDKVHERILFERL